MTPSQQDTSAIGCVLWYVLSVDVVQRFERLNSRLGESLAHS